MQAASGDSDRPCLRARVLERFACWRIHQASDLRDDDPTSRRCPEPAATLVGAGRVEPVRWAVISAAVALLALVARIASGSPRPRQSSAMASWRSMILLVVWMAIQSFWAMDKVEHRGPALVLHQVRDRPGAGLQDRRQRAEPAPVPVDVRAVRFLFGWIAFTSYDGGRFESFGGAGLGEATPEGSRSSRACSREQRCFSPARCASASSCSLIMPFLMNGLVTTISRGGFSRAGCRRSRLRLLHAGEISRTGAHPVRAGGVLSSPIAGPAYWQRACNR